MAENGVVQEAADSRPLDLPAPPGPPVGDAAVPTTAGNKVIGQMRATDDPHVGEKFGTPQIADVGGQAIDTARVMKDIQQLYDKAIADPKRQALFHSRMEDIQKFDPKTFEDMIKIAGQIGGTPPLSASDTGKELAAALQDTIKRHSAPGQPADIGSDGMMTVLGGMSGLMLAERGTFDPSKKDGSTRDMADAAEAQLRTQPGVNGVMTIDGTVIPVSVHGVMWGDNGEPALCAYSANYQVDRHKFEMHV